MGIKTVSTAKFDAIIEESISLGYCPKCRSLGGKIQVEIRYERDIFR